MPLRKIPTSLIGDRRKRGVTFSKRKAGLLKKARELATLCDVPVAVACVGLDGGAPDAWESEEGVFARFLALPDEVRAEHTHAWYLRERLGKEKAKLARQRQDGPNLLTADAALRAMTTDELQEVLAAMDAALCAAGERMKALGLEVAPKEDDGADDGRLWLDAHAQLPYANQFPYANDDNNYDQLLWDGFLQPGNGVAQSMDNGNANDGWPHNLVMPTAPMHGGDDNYVDSLVEHRHPSPHIEDHLLDAVDGLSSELMMDADSYCVGDNFMDADGYETRVSSEAFQCSATRQSSCTSEELRYLADVAKCMNFSSRDF